MANGARVQTGVTQAEITRALAPLIGWLETWRDPAGAYNGFVVHRTETKRMGRVHDTAWAQAAIVRGYGNLYRKCREQRWGDAMVRAADLLASRYDPETGRWRHTGHEDERFQSLVSCALGVCALLSIADLVDAATREKYVELASDHARRYWMDVLWVEREGAFKFTEKDYYSPGEDRFVVNFNAMTAEALLAIGAATGAPEFRERALAVGDWLLARWEETQRVNHALLKGNSTVAADPDSPWMAPGGFSYQFTTNDRQPDNYVTLYAGLSLRGFWALYQATREERYGDLIRAQSDYILAMRDPETRLFYHTARKGKVEKNPQFVAGAGMTLLGLHEAMPLLGDDAIPSDTVSSILSRAYVNGSYPGFIGKNDTGYPKRRRGGVVWEDVVSSVNWNAQWFEYLTRLVDDPGSIETVAARRTVRILTSRFAYIDTPAFVAILSWFPPRSWGAYLYGKRHSAAWAAFNPLEIYARLRGGRREGAPVS